jgi:heptosyltransferase-2
MINYIRRVDCFIGAIAYIVQRMAWLERRNSVGISLEIKRILCIKLWGLGNLAIIFPLLRNIKNKFPNAQVTFLTFDLNKGFLEHNDSVDNIIYFVFTKHLFILAKQIFSLVMKLKKDKIDMVINFETFNNTSALFSYFIKAPIRLGLHNRFEGVFYTHPFINLPSEHISQTFSNLLFPLDGCKPYHYFNFCGSGKNMDTIKAILGKYKIRMYVCIHPGTSDNFKGKRYRKEYFAKIAELLLRKHGIDIIFTGTRSEDGLIRDVINIMPYSERVFNLAGKLGIGEFIELLKRSNLFISNDSGPVHIAASLGINIAAFYGPTSPARYGPLNKNSLVFYQRSACSPCVGTDYINKKCDNNFRCLDFSPEEIFHQISEIFFYGQKNSIDKKYTGFKLFPNEITL